MENPFDIREALVLAILTELDRRNLSPVTEYDLHQLVRGVQPKEPETFRYIDQPISYSFDLQEYLRQLEKHQYLDDLLITGDSALPRHEYELRPIGRVQAQDQYQNLLIWRPDIVLSINELLDCFAKSHRPKREIA